MHAANNIFAGELIIPRTYYSETEKSSKNLIFLAYIN
jgi:hypothetical protein